MSHAEPEHNRPPEGEEVIYEHHPSCKMSDQDLVWHCHQCGHNEPAGDIEEEHGRITANLAMQVQEISHKLTSEREKAEHAMKGWERADKALTIFHDQHEKTLKQLAAEQENAEKAAVRAELAQIQLAQAREILKSCEPFAESWAAEDLLDRIRDALLKQ